MATGRERVATVPARRSNRSADAKAGFTLVERLVILAIIGLATGVAVRFAGGFGAGRRAERLSAVEAAEAGRWTRTASCRMAGPAAAGSGPGRQRRVATSVAVNDGHTLALSGLTQEKSQFSNESLPVLGTCR